MTDFVDALLTHDQQMAFVAIYFGLLVCAVGYLIGRIPGIHDEPKDEPVSFDIGGLM